MAYINMAKNKNIRVESQVYIPKDSEVSDMDLNNEQHSSLYIEYSDHLVQIISSDRINKHGL